MPIAALVDETTDIVANVNLVTNQPPAVPGFQWIPEAQWLPGQQPSKGDLWDGTIPASFTTPAPVDQGDLTDMDPYELLERSKQLAQDIIVAVDLAQQKNGGPQA